MVIAVPAAAKDREGLADPRFGRASYFYIRTEDGQESFLENTQNLNAAQGAGIQSAQNLLGQGVEVLLTGHCGPKAYRVLTAGGVKIYTIPPATLLTEAIAAFESGDLTPMKGADVEGHWV